MQNAIPQQLCFVASFLWLVFTAGSLLHAAEVVGERPYEMVWANRTNEPRQPFINFEQLAGWSVSNQNAVALFASSREQQLWGQYVGKLSYRAEGKTPLVTIKPPQPLPVPLPFDSVNLWVYGNNWAWAPDPTTPPAEISVMLRGKSGLPTAVRLGSVNWKEWFLLHRKLTPAQLALLKEGAVFEGIQIANGQNAQDRTLYFDNLSLDQEQLSPLSFSPRPRRGVEPFPGQSPGLNTGPGQLPFPNREQTLLPDNLAKDFKVQLSELGRRFTFRYQGADGVLEYVYEPKTGTLGDITARWEGTAFQPMAEGGVQFHTGTSSSPQAPEQLELVSCQHAGETVVAKWRARFKGRTAEVTYSFRLWQKSLVADVACAGGEIGAFVTGRARAIQNPRLVTLPYLSFLSSRPAVLITGAPERPLFIFALLDYYHSNGSELWAENEVGFNEATFNGGSRYLPKTDGKRNDCFERLFLTVSPRFEEVLPNIPNPSSPWMHVAGERLWIAHAADNRERDYAHWKEVARYGMTNIVITDHETGWRDGGESFTFRTRAAPRKGGDPGQAEYARKIRALGFCYGIYNNYTDFAPVNEFWHEDMVTRTSAGQWRGAWARCYNPKPARAVEYEARLAPIIQDKFAINTAYCDVHTAVAPWSYCDYDARVPGAGTFAATLYAYGEIMLHQKATWQGPVYSEGNQHWYYCGLTDGNYAQDQSARLPVNPWLVDFDLRKLHPLCCNFGMGNLDMFFGDGAMSKLTPGEREARFDRFLAATLAFGHTGFFASNPARSDHGVRSYFALQQLHASYALALAEEIRYADQSGALLDTTAAVATGAFRRSQIFTRYSNGLRVWVNGHPTQSWKIAEAELPPNGWYATSADGKLIGWSANLDGHRADFVDSPAYLYADGRGQFTRFPQAASDGQCIAHKRPDGSFEIIPVGKCASFGLNLGGRPARAIALAKERKELGQAETRMSRGLAYVIFTNNAFSYLLTPGPGQVTGLSCTQEQVVAGETVTIVGKMIHSWQVPAAAKPEDRLWQQFEDTWIDFTVVPFANSRLSVEDKLVLELVPRLPMPVTAQITLDGQIQTALLAPQQKATFQFPFSQPAQELIRTIPLTIRAGEFQHQEQWQLLARRTNAVLLPWPEMRQAGQGFRNKAATAIDGGSGAVFHPEEMACGNVRKSGLCMHPPYKNGTGYVFALYEPVTLPSDVPAAFRCEVGKRDGSDRGDGILFRVLAVVPSAKTADGKATEEVLLTEKQWAEHKWTALEGDLSRWAGQTVQLKIVADVGPADNSAGDWACWANLRIESREPLMKVAIGK